jgi:hypothetical protein
VGGFGTGRTLEIPYFNQLEYLVADGPVLYEEIHSKKHRDGEWISRKNFPKLRRLVSGWTQRRTTRIDDAWFARRQPRSSRKRAQAVS